MYRIVFFFFLSHKYRQPRSGTVTPPHQGPDSSYQLLHLQAHGSPFWPMVVTPAPSNLSVLQPEEGRKEEHLHPPFQNPWEQLYTPLLLMRHRTLSYRRLRNVAFHCYYLVYCCYYKKMEGQV